MNKIHRNTMNSIAIVTGCCMGLYYPYLFDIINFTTFLLIITAELEVIRRVKFQEGMALWSVCGTVAISLFWTSNKFWLVWVRLFAMAGHFHIFGKQQFLEQ